MKPATALIKHALKIGAMELLPEGRALNSGRVSPHFFNSGLFTTGESLNLLGDVLGDTFKDHWEMLQHPTVIFGPAYKGICLAALAASTLGTYSHRELREVKYAHDRKEEKQHGEGGRLVGASVEGQRVVIVDDVITTGGTKDESVKLITEHGGTVTGLVVLFDRQERSVDSTLSAAQEFASKHNVPVIAVAKFKDLLDYIKSHSARSPETIRTYEAMVEYQRQYGA